MLIFRNRFLEEIVICLFEKMLKLRKKIYNCVGLPAFYVADILVYIAQKLMPYNRLINYIYTTTLSLVICTRGVITAVADTGPIFPRSPQNE